MDGLGITNNKFKNKEYSVCGSRTSSQGVLELEKEIKGFKVIMNRDKSEGIKPFISNLKT